MAEINLALRSPSGHGYGAAYGLGLFSGIASACCAPVLAGDIIEATGKAPRQTKYAWVPSVEVSSRGVGSEQGRGRLEPGLHGGLRQAVGVQVGLAALVPPLGDALGGLLVLCRIDVAAEVNRIISHSHDDGGIGKRGLLLKRFLHLRLQLRRRSLLARLHGGEINLLVGTQMIAKGHDIHGVTLVGVVGADFQLGLPDFRAAERVFQLLTQVSGRAGRGDLPGKVLVQTYHPDHYAIQFAATHDYPGFVAKEMNYRRWMHYPPFAVLANVVIQSEKLEEATAWAGTLGRWFQQARLDKVRVLGPAAAPIVRLKRIYRFHFVLKAERRQALGSTLRAMLAYAETQGIARRNLVVDVDAVHLM